MENLLSDSDIESARRGDENPIGLKLTKTRSLLKKMNTSFHQPVDPHKAVNFPVSCLQIGQWKVKPLLDEDLIVRCYFRKCQLVWEFLDPLCERKLKKKIEIDWHNITAIKATSLAKAGILDIKLENPPKFFREINQEARKHTHWEPIKDFTHNCQGSFISIHKLKFTPGIFEKFWQHVIHGDSKLFELSQRPFPNISVNHLAMDFSGHDSSQNQEGSNGHTLIGSETWDVDNMNMLVDDMNISSIPLTTSGMPSVNDQSQFASSSMPNGHMGIEPQLWSLEGDYCNYGNHQSQFASSSMSTGHMGIEPQLWSLEGDPCNYGNDQSQFASSSMPKLEVIDNGHMGIEPQLRSLEGDPCNYGNDQSQFATLSMPNLEVIDNGHMGIEPQLRSLEGDHCNYGNDQSQFASSSMPNLEVIDNGHMRIEPQLWSILEGMEFPRNDGSNSLNQFANGRDHPTHVTTRLDRLGEFFKPNYNLYSASTNTIRNFRS